MKFKNYDFIFLFTGIIGLMLAFMNLKIQYHFTIGIVVAVISVVIFIRKILLVLFNVIFGYISYYAKKYDTAKKCFTKVLQFRPSMGSTLNWYLGNICERQGNYEEALENYKELLKFDANNVLRIYNIGNTLLRLKRFDEALREFQKIVELDPEVSYGHFGCGCACLNKGMYRKALDYFNRAIQLKKKDYLAYYNRAITYKHLGNKKEALRDYERVQNYKPKNLKFKPLYEDIKEN